MVLRKEEVPEQQPDLVPAPLSHAHPPYPTTPLDEHPPTVSLTPNSHSQTPHVSTSAAFSFKTPDEAQQQSPKEDNDSDYSDDEWDRSDDEGFEQVDAKDLPAALKPAGGKAPVTTNTVPDALRPGPPAGIPIKRSLENMSPMPTGASSASYGAMSTVSEQSNGSIPLQTNNPYLKAQQTGQSAWGGETSQQIWGDSHAQSDKYEPVELPALHTPTTPSHDFAKIDLNKKPLPNQPPAIAVNSPTPLTSPQSGHPRQDALGSNPWGPDPHATSDPITAARITPADQQHTEPQTRPEQKGFAYGGMDERNQGVQSSQQVPIKLDHGPDGMALAQHPEQTHTNPFVAPPPPANMPPIPPTNLPPQAPVATEEEQKPDLPPRHAQAKLPPTMPPQPIDTGVGSTSSPGPESPNTRMTRQRKEHYQIKHIRWHDVNKPGIRTSPILTQNLNGPCPLLALVNALVLSTPSGIETALVDTLRTREQVSLGLLLDAVFDELMSGRRGTAAQELPDVSDLYKFLLALHTGLNVNPMFVPEEDATTGNTSLTKHASGQLGAFENTPDMQLYRTFNIPLVHGWLPDEASEAQAAFSRVAKSYETSQYVQFQEEELDGKLQSGEPLTTDEQQMFTDIHSIKEFLTRWPTQLTEHGLQSLRNSIQPGQVAILFRNDHFSTLFKDPRTDRLLTLVTDQGYSSHDEIVWESLVDVNGQGSELFSGDFRPVGNHSTPDQQDRQTQSMLHVDNSQGWNTAPSRRVNQQESGTTQAPQGVQESLPLSKAEQEDHDLALALQLQEEEEDRQRRETAQRERDNQASVSAIAVQSQARPDNRRTSRGEVPPVIPPRRNNVQTHRPAGEAAPPPTYEEASTTPQYHPPQGRPASTHAPFPPQCGSAYLANTGGMPHRPAGRPMQQPLGRPGRRQSAGAMGANGQEERERCIVM
ncbi:hypothetical protein BDU57DRAFT_518525 [Ampelomyces quisqualis]|uniref:MINDY deubiquitinase domain-containing protein n=1 Tax=Ampelomyces quisqualis TaxID=50730 RepID=A0A6A5QIF6_AMPQU|nr:hypothetical protein BDU57DRAFT_518525 [Ampelomyces quisqualis]